MLSKIKTVLICALVILIITDITGNKSYNSKNSSLLISGICFDVTDEGLYDMAFVYMVPTPDGSMRYKALRTCAESIGGCISLAEKQSGSRLLFGQTDVVFLSGDAITSGDTFGNIRDYLLRNVSIGYSVQIYCIKEKISGFVRCIDEAPERTAELFDNIIIREPYRQNFVLTLSDMVSAREYYAVGILNISSPGSGGGIVAMKADEYICSFGDDLLRAHSMLTKKDAECFYRTHLGEFRTDKVKCRIRYLGKLDFSVAVDVKFSSVLLYGYHSLQGEMIRKAENMMNEAIKKDIINALGKMREAGADIIGINEYMHRFRHSEKAELDERNINPFTDGNFAVSVNSHFSNNGIMY